MKRIFSGISIRSKALIGVLLVGTLTSGSIVVYFSTRFETDALHAMAEKAEVVSEMTAYQIGTALGSKDERAVDQIVRYMSHLPDVRFIVIRRGPVNVQSSFNPAEAESLSFMDLTDKRTQTFVHKTILPVIAKGREV